MKKITVEYGTDGKVLNVTDAALYFEQENEALQIDAKISTDKKLRGYLKASNGNSLVTKELSPAEGVYSITVEDSYMSKGTLYVGFEAYDDKGYVERYQPVKVYIDGFVGLGDGQKDNVYVVTVSVSDVVTLEADAPAYVKNTGTKKDLCLEFGIPRGEKGDKGDVGATGPKGDKGDTGPQGPKGEKGDIGPKGDTGPKGEDGNTPIKGVDYYTPEEVEQIKADVASSVEAGLSKYKRSGAIFTFDGKSYILMDHKTEHNGTVYYGILRAKNLASGSWSYPVDGLYLKNPSTDDGVEYVELYKGYSTNLQDLKQQHFGGFGDFVIGEDYEWSFGKKADGKALAVRGSVGIPTFNQLVSIAKTDKQSNNKYSRTITRSTLVYNGKVHIDFFDDAPVDRGVLMFDEADNLYKLSSDVNTTDWYIMTYVSEEFFKTVHIDLYEAGLCAKRIIRRDFSYTDLDAIYNPGELNIQLGIDGGAE